MTSIRNTTFVIMFAAMMMAMPLASSNVFADVTTNSANLDAECGFDFSDASIDFGNIQRGDSAADIGEKIVTIPTIPSATGSSKITVTTTSWNSVGGGASAQGSLNLVGVETGTAVTVGNNIYTATNADGQVITSEIVTDGDGVETTEETIDTPINGFIVSGEDVDDATALSNAINTLDSQTFTSTTTDNTVSIVVNQAGTEGNSIPLSADNNDVVVTPFAGGTTEDVIIMEGETTRFSFSGDGSDVSGSYDDKQQSAIPGNKLVVLSGTDPTQSLLMSIMIDPISADFFNLPYSGSIAQEMTIDVSCDGTQLETTTFFFFLIFSLTVSFVIFDEVYGDITKNQAYLLPPDGEEPVVPEPEPEPEPEPVKTKSRFSESGGSGRTGVGPVTDKTINSSSTPAWFSQVVLWKHQGLITEQELSEIMKWLLANVMMRN